MNLFVKADDLFLALGTTDAIMKALTGALIRIDRNDGGHNYGNINDLLEVSIDDNTILQRRNSIGSKKGSYFSISNLVIPNKKHGNSIYSSEFSIAINSREKLEVIRKILDFKMEAIGAAKNFCNEVEAYLDQYDLDRLTIDNFISDAITNILETEHEITTRTKKLVSLVKKEILV